MDQLNEGVGPIRTDDRERPGGILQPSSKIQDCIHFFVTSPAESSEARQSRYFQTRQYGAEPQDERYERQQLGR